MVRIKRNSHNKDCIQFFWCLFGLFGSAFNAYNLKSLLGPNITLAKIFTSGSFGLFSQTIFQLYCNLILHNINLHHLRKYENTPSIVIHRTLKINRNHYTENFRISIRNFPLLYTTVLISIEPLRSPYLLMIAMSYQYNHIINLTLNHYIYKLTTLVNVNAHVSINF